MKTESRCSATITRALFPALRAGVVGVAALLATGQAQANAYCVSTSAQLQSALNDASDGGMYNGEDNYIAVVQGIYFVGSATGNGPFHYHSSAANGTLNLQGGFDAGCSKQTLDATLTVLDGNHAAQVLALRSAENGVTVVGFTIQNGETTARGAGLSINAVAGDNGGAFVQGNVLRFNHTTGQAGGLYVFRGVDAAGRQDTYIRNNVIVDNSADGGYGAGMVIGNGGDVDFDNGTVTRNATSLAGGVGGLYFGGTAVFAWVDNSIFWMNTNTGLFLANSNTRMEYNDYGTLGGATPFSSVGNVAVNPGFVDAAGGNFHLTRNSPLLALSPEIFNGVDPDGHVDPLHGKMDVGAYNETIFIAALDGN